LDNTRIALENLPNGRAYGPLRASVGSAARLRKELHDLLKVLRLAPHIVELLRRTLDGDCSLHGSHLILALYGSRFCIIRAAETQRLVHVTMAAQAAIKQSRAEQSGRGGADRATACASSEQQRAERAASHAFAATHVDTCVFAHTVR